MGQDGREFKSSLGLALFEGLTLYLPACTELQRRRKKFDVFVLAFAPRYWTVGIEKMLRSVQSHAARTVRSEAQTREIGSDFGATEKW